MGVGGVTDPQPRAARWVGGGAGVTGAEMRHVGVACASHRLHHSSVEGVGDGGVKVERQRDLEE